MGRRYLKDETVGDGKKRSQTGVIIFLFVFPSLDRLQGNEV